MKVSANNEADIYIYDEIGYELQEADGYLVPCIWMQAQ